MKQSATAFTFKMLFTFLLLCCLQTITWAQDSSSSSSSSTTSTTDVRTSATGENWYASPWVWVIGAAVFILLLIALTRGGSSNRTTGAGTTDASTTDRVTVTKTVRRDTDVDTDV